MIKAPLASLLLLAIVGAAAGQYLENQEYDVDENGLPMDSGNVDAEEQEMGEMAKREDEREPQKARYQGPPGYERLAYQDLSGAAWRNVIGDMISNQERANSEPARPKTPQSDQDNLNQLADMLIKKAEKDGVEPIKYADFVVEEDDEEEEESEKEKRAAPLPEKAFLMSTSKPLGEISGMAMDKKGRLVVFHRADRVWDENTFDENNRFTDAKPIVNSTIAIINATTGQVLEEHGENLFFLPHGLSIDDEGSIWVTDVGSHQIHKLGADYKPVLTLGERLVPGTDGAHFCQPTDVAVAKNGIFFVADGYCNSRVVKFDRNGNVLAVFEAPDDQAGSSPFAIPHSLALIEDMNMLCVADRENERVQCYSSGLAEGHRSIPAGIPITSAENIGRVYAIREKNHYLVGVTGADVDGTLEPQLFTMDMQTGKANTFLKGIENAHALAISDEGKVYVGQMTPNQIVVVDLA